jgi:hypothetical protein
VPSPPITYQIYDQGTAQVHVVAVPPEAGIVDGAVPEALVPLADQATGLGAIAALNGGFFDPQNGLTTSFVTVDGTVVADPRQNPRLMDNPELQSYLPAILDRSEFRRYTCGAATRYAIAPHSAPIPADCTLAAAVGAGPQLLPQNRDYLEGFVADNAAGERVRDALGSQSPNARSAVALTADGTVLLVMAAQGDPATTPGFTLAEMAAFLTRLGAIAALNLDGGSSSGLYFDGNSVYGRRDREGQPLRRPIKAILWVRDIPPLTE